MRLKTPAYHMLEECIGQVRNELHHFRILRGLFLAIAVALVSAIGLFLLDNAFHFSTGVRGVLTPAWGILTGLAVLLLVVRPAFRRPTKAQTALAIQQRYPHLQERVINAVQVCEADSVNPFVGALVEESAKEVYPLDLSKVPDRRQIAFAGGIAGVLLALGLVYGFAFQPYFVNAAQRYLHPSQEIGTVGAPQLMVTPGHASLTTGQDLDVRAVTLEESSYQAYIRWRVGAEDWQTVPMNFNTAQFTHVFTNVGSSFVYQVRAGKSLSDTFRVSVHPPLGLSRIRMHYEFPAYTRLSAKDNDDSDGRIETLAGTRVTLKASSCRPVKSAEVILKDLEGIPMTVEKSQELSAEFTVQDTSQYSLRMIAETGESNPAPLTYPIVATPDTPPHVELSTSLSQGIAAPSDSIPLHLAVKDDFGAGSVLLTMRVEKIEKDKKGEEPADWRKIQEWKIKAPKESLALDHSLDLAGLGLAVGTRLVILAQATDLNDFTGPGTGTSEELVIEIKEQGAVADQKNEAYSAGLEALAALIQQQKENLDESVDIQARLSPEGHFAGSDQSRLGLAQQKQVAIREKTLGLSKSMAASHPAAPLTLDPLAANDMVEAIRGLESGENDAAGSRGLVLKTAAGHEQKILQDLQELLERLTHEQHAIQVQEVLQALREIRETQAEIQQLTGKEEAALEKLATEEGSLHPKMRGAESMLAKLAGNLRPLAPELSRAADKITEETRQRRIPADISQAQTFLQEAKREQASTTETEVLQKLDATIESLLKALVENSKSEKDQLAKALEESLKKAEILAALEKKVQEAIQALNQKNEDDLGNPEQKKFEKMAEFQERAAQVSATAAEDLKKMPQNPLTGDMAKEWQSLTGKLDQAKELLQKQEPKEVCMECTEEIMKKLMKVQEQSKDGMGMLDTVPDMTKFNLKDIPEGKMPQLNIPELPEKLMDMVGELIDEQEDQNEDTNDKSSNWAQADSKAGVAKEGPISSFGGKGKTGNHRPDPTEISGRGGAGRTGQTSGELVEGATKNLDGDPTPERRTPDAVQEGEETIEDNNPKPATATGGGKKGGAGGEGLPGKPNDVFEEDLEELAERQDSLRASAEQLESALSSVHLPTWTIPDAVKMMEAAERDLKSYNLSEAQEKQKIALHALKMAYEAMKGKPYVDREAVASLPEDLKRQVIQSQNEGFPPAFKDLLQRYYQEISDKAVK